MSANTTQREGREGQGRASKKPPFPGLLPRQTGLGKGGKGVTTPYSARARRLYKDAILKPVNPLPALPSLPKGFFTRVKRGKGVIVCPSRPSRGISLCRRLQNRGVACPGFLALFVATGFAAPLSAPACGDLTPDPATMPPIVRPLAP